MVEGEEQMIIYLKFHVKEFKVLINQKILILHITACIPMFHNIVIYQ